MLLVVTLPAFAGSLNLVYERVVTDSYGNEIGYRSTRVSSPSDLPSGSAWRNYLNLKLADGRTIFEYASTVSKSLSQTMNLTLSDRDSNSYTAKSSTGGYNLNLYKYINNFASDSSKTFLFLHEFGHVAMLNAYPSSYNFNNLNYGSDNKHYIDEILPDDNTAWVEGWANAFAANKNNGKVFSFDLNSLSSLAFLKDSSFGEMARNELFVGKVLFDCFNKITSGKDKVFNIISSSGPQYSLLQFCQKYVSTYPDDKAALAKVLFDNSQGRMTLDQLLLYVNNGSRNVSRALYNYLATAGLVAPTSSTTAQPTRPTTTTSTTTTTTTTTNTSFWGRLSSWFGKLFNFGAGSPSLPTPAVSVEVSGAMAGSNEAAGAFPSVSASAEAPINNTGSIAAETTSTGDAAATVEDLGRAEELYYQRFAEYNRLMASSDSSKQQVSEAHNRMLQAKTRVKALRRLLK